MRPDFILKNVMVYQTFRQCFEKRDVAVAGKSFIAFPLQFHIRVSAGRSTEKADTCCLVSWISICTSRAR